MGQEELGATYKKALIKIKRLRGKASFCKKAGINNRTFDRLAKEGTALPYIIVRVQAELDKDKEPITELRIKEQVAQSYKVEVKDLINPRPKSDAGDARQVSAYIIYRLVTDNYAEIARMVGYKERTGALVAIKTISDRYSVESDLRKQIDRIISKLYQ